jgi:hypothetical protein
MHTFETQQRHTPARCTMPLGATLFLLALATTACSPPSSDAKVAAAERHGSRNSEATKGTGHLHVTGDVTKDADFAIDGCQIGKPGDGLLDGYRMHAEDGDSSIIMLSVLLRDYVKDGPYVADTTSAGQLKEGMSSGNFGSLSLMLAGDGSSNPLAFGLTSSSKLVVTISDDGAKGKAELVNMESQPGMAEMIAARNSNGKPHGKTISGSVTWSCGHVDHLNGEMNKAVDGMMDKLMPNH